MERSTRKIALVGIILLVVGLIAWIVQLTGGLLAGSNMTNVFLWGLMIAVFAFLVGFGAGSQFVASAIILSGKEELKPLARIAGACGLACVCAAGVAILADLGAIRNALAMIVGMNASSSCERRRRDIVNLLLGERGGCCSGARFVSTQLFGRRRSSVPSATTNFAKRSRSSSALAQRMFSIPIR